MPEEAAEAAMAATVRLALWSAHHRWPVLGLWFLFCFGMIAASAAAGGQRDLSITQRSQGAGEAQTGYAVFADASGPNAASTQPFYLVVESKSGPLDTPANRVAISVMVASLSAAKATVGGTSVPVFYADSATGAPPVVDPYAVPAAASGAVLSPDGTSALVVGHVAGADAEATAKSAVLPPLVAGFRASYPGLAIYGFDDALIGADFGNYVTSSLDSLLPPTLLVAVTL